MCRETCFAFVFSSGDVYYNIYFFQQCIHEKMGEEEIKATLPYLAGIELETIDEQKEKFKADRLWSRDGGAVIMVVRRPG